MTQAVAKDQEKQDKQSQPPPAAPPEESIWIRYSAHHEFPLSSVTSVGVHVLVFGLIALAVWMGLKLFKDQDKSLSVEAITIGGGGGNPDGVGSEPGARKVGDPEAVEHNPKERGTPVKPDPLNPVKPAALQLPEIKDPDIRRLIDSGNDAVAAINQLNQDTRAKLAKGLRAGEGKGGGGSGGGDGKGTGTGKGDGVGPGSGKLSAREKRVLRWTMIFDTQNGEDYAKQLQALDAILAIPEPGQPDKHLVIRNLGQRPAQPAPEDLSEIKRIYWVDNKPQSVDQLARALQLKQFPGHFVAFFPEQLEKDLLEMELKHARGRTEDQIQETKFKIRRAGNSYRPEIIDQKYLR